MTQDNPAKFVFLDAIEVPAIEREAFVVRACAGDAELLARVRGLLAARERSSPVLEQGPATPLLVAEEESLAAIDVGPGDRVGPYRLGEVLGEGGFGVVFRATQSEPVRREVALKVVKLGMDTRAVVARFEVERQALALMDHPAIARVFDAGATESGRPYFAMELVEGGPITGYFRDHDLGLRERLAVFERVCRAVQHAHQRGVLHRDLKPSNVLVAEVDGRPEPRIIDFGIAKATGGELAAGSLLTRDGFLLGTPAYMSPEQARAAPDVDTRADVYSLGVLLYELVAGVPPFDAGTLALPEFLKAVLETEPKRPSTRLEERRDPERDGGRPGAVPAVPRELDWIVMRCLEKERERRYASAGDLANDVARFLADEPLEAAPPGLAYRLGKLARRHRAAALSVAAVSLALVAGIVATGLALLRAERINERLDLALERTEDANRSLDLALAEARRQAAIAEAVNGFLEDDLLGAARPTGATGRGPDVPIGSLLEDAARALEEAERPGGRFASEPLVSASLHETLGATFLTLGAYEPASRHLERTVELRTDALGESDASTLSAVSLLGWIRRRAGDLREAAALQERAYGRFRGAYGLEHEGTLSAIARLAAVRRDQGRGASARALLEEALPAAVATLGEGAPVTADLRAALAAAYTDAGRYAEAEKLLRAVEQAQLELTGPENPIVLNTRTNLATVLRISGRAAEAERIYREVLDVQRRVEGPEHPNVLSTLFNLTECLRATGRLDEAADLLAEGVPLAEKVHGPDHPTTLLWWLTQARLLEQLGDYERAAQGYRRVWERTAATRGEDSREALDVAGELAGALARGGNWDEAAELYGLAYEGEARVRGESSQGALEARVTLGIFTRLRGERDRARELLEGARELAGAALGADHPTTLRSAAALAALEVQDGDLAGAAELLELSSSLADPPEDAGRAAWRASAVELANAYARAGNGPEAERWTERARDTLR